MCAEGTGRRLVNAKIEILGSTDLNSAAGSGGGIARPSLSSLLSAGVRTGMPRTSSYFSPAPPSDGCEANKRERANTARERGREGREVINIEIHGIIYQYFTQFNVIRADNERGPPFVANVLGVEAVDILRFQRRLKGLIA